jgi:hypothetical protein
VVGVEHIRIVSALEMRRICTTSGLQFDYWTDFHGLLTNIEAPFLASNLGKEGTSLRSVFRDASCPQLLCTMGQVWWEGAQGYLASPDLFTDIMARVSSDKAGCQSNRGEKCREMHGDRNELIER